uniref:Uncharacterized protein n=1 Tax=Leersia perrieri TaxID=77586 RepID=A0A0D9W4X1_9ORYZ
DSNLASRLLQTESSGAQPAATSPAPSVTARCPCPRAGTTTRHVRLLGRPSSHLPVVPPLPRVSPRQRRTPRQRQRRTPRQRQRRSYSTDDLQSRCHSPTTPEAPPTTTQALRRGDRLLDDEAKKD